MSTIPTPYVKMEKRFPSPTYNSHYTKNKLGGRNCCRFICSLCIFLFLLILNLSLIAIYLFTVSNSQVPSYTVENLEVKAFDWQPNFTLETQFVVTVKAYNPNSKIGLVYGEDSSVNVVYNGTDVCSGKLPHFHQGPLNVTIIKVDLVGKSESGSDFQEASRTNSQIPLLVKVKVPVSIVAGEYSLREYNAFANCTLVVDNLAPNNKINIMSSNTTIDYEFNSS